MAGRGKGRRGPRAPGWGKEAVLRELAAGDTLHQIAAKYALTTSPDALVTEIVRWRARDAAFAARYDALMDRRGRPNRKAAGVKSKAEQNPQLGDWKLHFCEALFETGSRLKAAEDPRVPYSWKHLHQMITPGYPQHDAAFADMVHLVEMRFCAQMEAGMVEAFRDAKNPRDKAWIAKQWLERRDATRWGKQVEMIHSGQVSHTHEIAAKTREERLAELLADQQRFLTPELPAESRALPPAPEALEVIDVEVLSAEEVKDGPGQAG